MQDLIATLNAIQNQKTMAILAEVNRQADLLLLDCLLFEVDQVAKKYPAC